MKTKWLCICPLTVFMKELAWIVACPVMLCLCLVSFSAILSAQGSDGIHPEKIITAVRTNTPLRIDGVLDDEVWRRAPIATGFTQKDPDEGKPTTERTTVQIAYDDEALYAGVICYDREPDKIASRLYRRDQFYQSVSDWVSISLDPHHDHQTGNFFLVCASGTLNDGATSNDDDDESDMAWDGVWEAKTTIHEQGWTAEYRIPYHVLRFSQRDEYTWGINVDRFIGRKNEWAYWILVPKSESGWVSRFGHLEGIKGIHPAGHLEFLPFTLGRYTFESESLANPDGRELFSSVGLDVRYGLSTNLSLNTTINPDFGQVEADPAVLNLSVFETFFEERRPFFVEGSSIFRSDAHQCQLFYSRRIGKQPGRFPIPSGAKVIDQPNATTILGAVKLTGKTASKTSIGILNAVTAPEYATIEEAITDPITGLEQTERREHLIEPLTNYFVGRIQQDVLRGNSTVGILTTAVNREDAESAYLGAMDWNLRLGKNAHQFRGNIAAGRSGAEEDKRSGYLAHVRYDKISGWFKGGVGFSTSSSDFNPNDLGYIDRVNKFSPWIWMRFCREQPWWIFRQLSLQIGSEVAWNLSHEWAGIPLIKGGQGVVTERWVSLSKGVRPIIEAQLKNFWWFWSDVTYDFEAMDDLDTRGGPLIVKPAGATVQFGVEGDSRLSVTPSFWFSRQTNAKGSIHQGFGAGLSIKPASSVKLSIGPGYNRSFNKAQWVRNVDDDEDGIHDHFVYGELKSRTLDLTTRVNVTFTPDLSLQFYMQPFIAAGDYSNFKELARPASYEFTPYTDLDEGPDFSHRSLRSNLVFRWEYRPGSTLFLVWSQSRSASSDDPSFRPWDSVMESFSDKGQNIFLIKLNYWLGL